ncbi:hypothetical protein [Nostoc sp. NMS4]|uniref:hypothetical protein n=1 Tax=Nostoc sp. NMS4 TaxID=2815390 RepID=UPI0025FDD797|nr:hypothetical protein [Nostoc sp. NMS4]MBN3926389.1 hypothetical protein [Nostoc sp. NMS4]
MEDGLVITGKSLLQTSPSFSVIDKSAMSTTGYANAPFNNLRAVFAIFCIAPSFGSGAIAKYSPVYHSAVLSNVPPTA